MSIDRSALTMGISSTEPSVAWENEFKTKINGVTANAVDSTDGKVNASQVEIDADATVAGDRSLIWRLTASTTRVLKWLNSSGWFRMTDQGGSTLYALEVGTATQTAHATTKAQLDEASPVGRILMYAGSSAPTGNLLCDGAAVSRTTYAALFAVIGTTYGSGDGSTTFNVPDLRGRVPLGKDNMGGSAANRVTSASTNGANSTTLGGTGGAQTHQLVTAELPVHNHVFNGVGVTDAGTAGNVLDTATTQTANSSTGYAGGDQAHSNTQPWIVLNYIIKT